MEETTWGARMFLQSIRGRLNSRHVGDSNDLRHEVDPNEFHNDRFPKTWNILLLGPKDSGKSSVIYTFWRAIHEVTANTTADDMPCAMPIERLCINWNFMDFIGNTIELDIEGMEDPKEDPVGSEAFHGTQHLTITPIRNASAECDGINMMDAPGLQTFSHEEIEFCRSMIDGLAADGTTLGANSHGRGSWTGGIYPFHPAQPASGPHVVLLVFDMSSISFQQLILTDVYASDEWIEKVPQLTGCHRIIDSATSRGLQVFICLTHLDIYRKIEREKLEKQGLEKLPHEDGIHITEDLKLPGPVEHLFLTDDADGEGRLGESILVHIKGIYLQLSQCLSYGGRDVPPDRMFVLENYRNSKRRPEPRVDLAAVEAIEGILDAADIYLLAKYREAMTTCTIT
jgi:hypothetical protein